MRVPQNWDLPTYFKPWIQIKKSYLPTYSGREAGPESSRFVISSNIDPISIRLKLMTDRQTDRRTPHRSEGRARQRR